MTFSVFAERGTSLKSRWTTESSSGKKKKSLVWGKKNQLGGNIPRPKRKGTGTVARRKATTRRKKTSIG